jgi:hypothetical protein
VRWRNDAPGDVPHRTPCVRRLQSLWAIPCHPMATALDVVAETAKVLWCEAIDRLSANPVLVALYTPILAGPLDMRKTSA